MKNLDQALEDGLLAKIPGGLMCKKLLARANEVSGLVNYPGIFRPIMSVDGQPLLPTAVGLPFQPKGILKLAAAIKSQHCYSGGVFDFDGNFSNFNLPDYVPSEIRKAVKVLFTGNLVYLFKLDKLLEKDEYLNSAFKVEAILASAASRPCGAHYY